VIVAPHWSAAARRVLGRIGRTPYVVEPVEAPALADQRLSVEAETRPPVLAASASQLAARLGSSDARATFARAAAGLEGLAAKHGGAVRVGVDRMELIVLARRVAELRIEDDDAVLETQVGGRQTTSLAGADLASALDGLEGQLRRRLNDRKVREGEEGLRGRVVARLMASSELRGLRAWPVPGTDAEVIDAVGIHADGSPVLVAVREAFDWTALGTLLESVDAAEALLPLLFVDVEPPLRLGAPRLLLAAERFDDGLERALAALTFAYELRQVSGGAGASVDLVSGGAGEGAEARSARRGRRRGGRGRSRGGEDGSGADRRSEEEGDDAIAARADDVEQKDDADRDGSGRGRGRRRRRSRRGRSGGTDGSGGEARAGRDGGEARGGREGEEGRGAEGGRSRRSRFEEVSLMDLDDAPDAGEEEAGPRSGRDDDRDDRDESTDDGGSGSRRRGSRRGRRGGRGEARRRGRGGASEGPSDEDEDEGGSGDGAADDDLVDADDLEEILARLTDDEPDFETPEASDESFDDDEEIDDDEEPSARRREREKRRRSTADEEAARPAPRGRAAILVHADRDSFFTSVLLARDIRQLEGIWIYPQAELMTFFRSIATDLRDDTPIYVVGFQPSPARDVIQASSLYRGRLTWFDRHVWPPEDLMALRESLGADAIHGGEGIDSTLPLVLETCTRRSRFSDKLVDLATARFTQHDFERWGRLWRWRAAEAAKKTGDIRGDIAPLMAGRPSDLAKEASSVELPPPPPEVAWVAERDFRLVHFGGHVMVVLEVDPEIDMHLAARIARERYGATLSLARRAGESTLVLAGDEVAGKRALDYLAVAEHLVNKHEWVEARPDADHVSRFHVRDLARHPERFEEVVGEIAMGRSLLER
jgi:hypothetical protein